MSRELRELLKECLDVMKRLSVYLPVPLHHESMKLELQLYKVLSQPEAEPAPADAPTPDKCPECGNEKLFWNSLVTCRNKWHYEEPAPQQPAVPLTETISGPENAVRRKPESRDDTAAAGRGPTPETDAKEKETVGGSFTMKGLREHCYYGWKQARKLERQRDAARAELARLKEPKRAHSCDDPLCAVCGHPYG